MVAGDPHVPNGAVAAADEQAGSLSPKAYLAASGVALLVAVFFGFVRAYSDPSPAGAKFLEYLVLVVAGLAVAVVCFGLVRGGYAYVRGTHGPVVFEVGGPFAAFAITVGMFYWLIPLDDPFIVTIRVTSAKGDPIQGAAVKIHASESPAEKRTDDNGYARYVGLEAWRARSAEVDVAAPQFRACRARVEKLGSAYTVTLQPETTVPVKIAAPYTIKLSTPKGLLSPQETAMRCEFLDASPECTPQSTGLTCRIPASNKHGSCEASLSIRAGDPLVWSVVQDGQQVAHGSELSTKEGAEDEDYTVMLTLSFVPEGQSCLN